MGNEAAEVSEELIDMVVEWIGQKLRKSHIKVKLRDIYPDIKVCTIERLISLAKKQIVEIYNVDVREFKGSSIEFYCSVIRDKDASLKYKLVAQQRLDVLLGLENATMEDPVEIAQRIQEALKAMDESVSPNG